MPRIFDDTRADWGAARPDSWLSAPKHSAPLSGRRGITWHYDGGEELHLAFHPHSLCLAKVRADQRLHMGAGRGWGDIGYNGLVCPHGRAIEGRSLNTAGAHCPGFNHTHLGIQLMVGGNERPTDVQYARANQLARDLDAASGRRLIDNVHSDGFATACPGPTIRAWQRAGRPSSGLAGSVGNGSPSSPVGGGGSSTPVFEEDIVGKFKDLDQESRNELSEIIKGALLSQAGAIGQRVAKEVWASYRDKGRSPIGLLQQAAAGEDTAALGAEVAKHIDLSQLEAAIAQSGSGATAQQIVDELAARLEAGGQP